VNICRAAVSRESFLRLNSCMKLLLWTLGVAWFSVFAKHAIDLYGKRDHQQMWGAIALSLMPLMAMLLWNADEMIVPTRNVVLGLFGAAFGSALLIWAGYLIAGQKQASGSVKLVPPLGRHELQLKPNAVLFLLMNEEGKVVDNEWRVPLFRVRNLTSASIQDAKINWSIDLSAVHEGARKSPRFAGYTFGWSAPQLVVSGGKRTIAPFVFVLAQSQSYPVAFISSGTEGAEAFIPLNVFNMLALYAASTMPDDTGASIAPISLTVTVSWNLPSPGEQRFSVAARVVNGKPATVQDPEMILFVSFDATSH
jgi:hypothetical protein